ncbi:hypothetical protein KY338_05010 [Candidatus Woesearchaeota archaeon]|nr:hypothetical protein [Candidatus Woesearchaeota archaeon]MBW3005840.1 hypothetical protein [Candidatus Woesearchaeota archaeon]
MLKQNPWYINVMLVVFVLFIIENILSIIFVPYPLTAPVFGIDLTNLYVKLVWTAELILLLTAVVFTLKKNRIGLYAALIFLAYRALDYLITGIVIFSDINIYLQKSIEFGTRIPTNTAEWTATIAGISAAILTGFLIYTAAFILLIRKRKYYKN